jgi:nicotinic acid phosphoribosyltransferase
VPARDDSPGGEAGLKDQVKSWGTAQAHEILDLEQRRLQVAEHDTWDEMYAEFLSSKDGPDDFDSYVRWRFLNVLQRRGMR